MKLLKDRILKDGKSFDGGILKVDSFINHQMDPILMKSIGVEFVRRFGNLPINKIITIEASGIAPAIMLGYLLELPVVFVKKAVPKTMVNMVATTAYSFTKDKEYTICISRDFLNENDKVVFIDDFLANGNAAVAVNNLVREAAEGQIEELEAQNNPEDPQAGSHKVLFSRELYIERDDFMEDAPKKYFRLTPRL